MADRRLADTARTTPARPVLPAAGRCHPNEKYAALVAAAGYLPLTLTGEDYLELLPVAWRADQRLRHPHRLPHLRRPELGPYRRQHSGVAAKRGLWEVHYDPYDLSQVFVRTPDGWVTAPWTHLPMVSAPFADFTWRHARRAGRAGGADDTNETASPGSSTSCSPAPRPARADRRSARVAARTRAAAAAHRRHAPDRTAANRRRRPTTGRADRPRR